MMDLYKPYGLDNQLKAVFLQNADTSISVYDTNFEHTLYMRTHYLRSTV